MIVEFVTKILSTLTLLADIFIIVFIILLFLSFRKVRLANNLLKRISNRAKIIIFIISLAATSGSLFFSEIALYTPCKLCWLQRIFMYPLPIITGISLLFKDRSRRYVIALSGIGFVISGYHVLTNVLSMTSFCSAISGISCNTNFFLEYGYINIPVMSLSAFAIILILSLVSKSI